MVENNCHNWNNLDLKKYLVSLDLDLDYFCLLFFKFFISDIFYAIIVNASNIAMRKQIS